MSSSLGDFGTRCERVKSGRHFVLAARRKSFITNPRATVSVHTSVSPTIRSPLLSLHLSRQGDRRQRVTSSTSWKKCSCVFLLGDIIMIWFTGRHMLNLAPKHKCTPLLAKPAVAGMGLPDISGLKSHSFSLDSDSGSCTSQSRKNSLPLLPLPHSDHITPCQPFSSVAVFLLPIAYFFWLVSLSGYLSY